MRRTAGAGRLRADHRRSRPRRQQDRTRISEMSLMKWGIIGLLLIPVAEIAAFSIVALLIGWLAALCLFVATTALGLAILRRRGVREIDRLRAGFGRDGWRAIHLEAPGIAPLIGALLLILPGFLTDLLGALLFIPLARRFLLARLRPRGNQGPPQNQVIDLAPKDWRQIGEKPIRHRGPKSP
ncbi:MAG: FxsA family protein [Hyphomicrobiales bacterium]|nr:FxsA family protein [Hyphomicrobiales bacterium]